MNKIKNLDVFYHNKKVGTLALYKKYLAAFQYDKRWLLNGFSISPLSLPLSDQVFIPKPDPFDGLYGVFSDSLPDGWGRLLVDRFLIKNNINPYETDNLNRLSIVGETGMGALTYRPDFSFSEDSEINDYDHIASECKKILREEYTENLDSLFYMAGSSGGARPKILTHIDGEEWIIKFPSSGDPPDIGKQEYDYSLCAKECGISMSETRLFPSNLCEGYFGTKRFDSIISNGKKNRIHMISVSALLETSHRIPNLDYDILMKLTMKITGNFSEAEKLYRLMCFNVFAHNRDDHSKNFSYLYLEDEDKWTLSPAYDLTYSSSLGGEHATMVHGNGKDPGKKDLLAVAEKIGISKTFASRTADKIQECVNQRLHSYFKKN